jgi:hypothetical protein
MKCMGGTLKTFAIATLYQQVWNEKGKYFRASISVRSMAVSAHETANRPRQHLVGVVVGPAILPEKRKLSVTYSLSASKEGRAISDPGHQ